MMKGRPVPAFVLAAFMALAAPPAGAANLVVIASTAPGFAPGQIVHSDDPIEVPKGATVTLVSDTGNIVTVPGPHSGPAEIAAGPGGGGFPPRAPSGTQSRRGPLLRWNPPRNKPRRFP